MDSANAVITPFFQEVRNKTCAANVALENQISLVIPGTAQNIRKALHECPANRPAREIRGGLHN